MGRRNDEVVVVRPSEKEGEPSVVTVSCHDKTGLGSDLCHVLLFFGLSAVRSDVSTDGRWCYIVFWVVERWSTNWILLKERLSEACPSCYPDFPSFYRKELKLPSHPDVFLLKLSGFDRIALLYDVTEVLFELELIIEKVKVSTTPDGKAMDLFFITDTRHILHTSKGWGDVYELLKQALGDDMISCEIEKADLSLMVCSQTPLFLPPIITGDPFDNSLNDYSDESLPSNVVSITVDNTLSPCHTLIQIACEDHKGLLYDTMKVLKDHDIKISYGRFMIKKRRNCEMDLFLLSDGKKIVDKNKQTALCKHLQNELLHPLKVAVVSRGPDTELLVANPVELSGKGRPLVFYDITLALKRMYICIFAAEIGRHVMGGREWEIYRFLLDEGGVPVARNKLKRLVWNTLMGWD